MIDISSFEEIRAEFMRRVEQVVWCSMATNDARNRLRSRIVHPVWEGASGWILTRRHSPKEKHLAHNPYVSLSYWDPRQQQVHVEAVAEWVDADAEKRRVWDLVKKTPEPVGYDPALIWNAGPADPTYGVLKLTPWRIEVSSLAELMTGKAMIWKA